MGLEAKIYNGYKAYINEHIDENRESGALIEDLLTHSPLFYRGPVDKTAHIPKVFGKETIDDFANIAATSHKIFSKVINEYRKNADFRKLFEFPAFLEDLILLPLQYPEPLPIMRMDIFYDEKNRDFKFCEVNTDGSSGMLIDYELRRALIENPAHQNIIRKYNLTSFELFDTFIDKFFMLYSNYSKAVKNPNVAIVDFLENSTLREFEEFARRFQQRGVNCQICDIRMLKYKNGVLYSKEGWRIDCIYRRAVTSDIVANYDKVQDFTRAIKNENVFVVGPISTEVIHTKWLFYVLYNKMCEKFLLPSEIEFIKKHVPLTVEFSEKYIELVDVIENKDKYIIKPKDAYASKGIYAAGVNYNVGEWKKIVQELYNKNFICQEYCHVPLAENIDFAFGSGKWQMYKQMTGLYTYCGQFSGVLMRTAHEQDPIINSQTERLLPVFVAEGTKD